MSPSEDSTCGDGFFMELRPLPGLSHRHVKETQRVCTFLEPIPMKAAQRTMADSKQRVCGPLLAWPAALSKCEFCLGWIAGKDVIPKSPKVWKGGVAARFAWNRSGRLRCSDTPFTISRGSRSPMLAGASFAAHNRHSTSRCHGWSVQLPTRLERPPTEV